MEDSTLIMLLSGAAGAALIKLADGIIQFFLARRAKKEDKAEEKEERQAAEKEMQREKELQDLKSEIEALKELVSNVVAGQRIMMLDRIQYLCKTYIKEGKVDFDDRRRLHLMHKEYHAVDGNGDLDLLIEAVNALPLKEACGCDTVKS